MQYDIEEFYPSVSEDLLKKAIDRARTFVDISSEEEETIIHCRKYLLFNNTDRWIKKEGNKDFDVNMGSFDGAEVFELVGLYICETNLKIVNFLDVTSDLTAGKYKPYKKPGNIQLYINV